MRLTWRDVVIEDGLPSIFTAVSEREAAELERLARGRRVLEVGSAFGYSTVVMARVAEEVWSVDPHTGHDSLQALQANLEVYRVRERVKVCVGTSQQVSRVYDPEAGVPNGYFGLVFIDGDHSLPGVTHDLLWARRAVKPFGAVIACHDYDEDTCPGVKAALDAAREDWRAPSYLVDTLAVYSDPR